MSNFKPHPIGRFPYWADAELTTEAEVVGSEEKTVVPIPIPPYYYYSNQLETIEDHIGTVPVSPDALGSSDANLYPWEKWSQLPKVEREAEMREAQKEAAMTEANGDYASWTDAQSVTETEPIGNLRDRPFSAGKVNEGLKPDFGAKHHLPDSELTPEKGAPGETEAVGGESRTDPIGPFSYWDAVDPKFDPTGESILKESGMDGLRESDPQTAAADSLTGETDESTGNLTRTVREFFGQSDSVTEDALANADTDGSPSWFHMHHDDGIMDGYLDVGADASGFDSFLLQSGSDLITPIAEPFAEAAAITDLVTGQSSPMEAAIDPLVAAGPLDAVQVDEPRNNDF